MSALWRGSWTTQARIISGLVLLVYVLLHFINIGLGSISPGAADGFQDIRKLVFRSVPGTLLLYGALAVHAALALGKLALRSSLRLPWGEAMQVILGLIIPFLLATHIVFTRGSARQFETNDTVGYISGLIWGTADGWQQAALLLITWAHGCIGVHYWLRMSRGWRRALPWFVGFAVFVPAFALAGFMTEGRRVRAILTGGEEARLDFFDKVNWPGPSQFDSLIQQSDMAWYVVLGCLGATASVYGFRRLLRLRRSVRISYVDGPTISAPPGPTLLEISRNSGVPHTALCGGRGRCTTCRVIVEQGADDLPPPSEAEARTLKAVKAPAGSRLACQMRPVAPLTVTRVFNEAGQPSRAPASQGREADLAVLFLDMRGFTARTSGQLPYDIVFLLNRFFDAIVPAISAAGGSVDKYMGDGLLAVFDTKDAASSAKAALQAARGIEEELLRFNAQLDREGEPPLRIGIGLHLGGLVLGEIGAKGQSARTLIGDSVNTASRLEAKTKDLQAQVLISAPLLQAAGYSTDRDDMVSLELRGLNEPLCALPVPYDTPLQSLLDPD